MKLQAALKNQEKDFFIDFGKNICKVSGNKKNIYINLTSTQEVYFDCGETSKTCIIYDFLGDEIEKMVVQGLLKINVPHSGMVVVMEEQSGIETEKLYFK